MFCWRGDAQLLLHTCRGRSSCGRVATLWLTGRLWVRFPWPGQTEDRLDLSVQAWECGFRSPSDSRRHTASSEDVGSNIEDIFESFGMWQSMRHQTNVLNNSINWLTFSFHEAALRFKNVKVPLIITSRRTWHLHFTHHPPRKRWAAVVPCLGIIWWSIGDLTPTFQLWILSDKQGCSGDHFDRTTYPPILGWMRLDETMNWLDQRVNHKCRPGVGESGGRWVRGTHQHHQP